MELKRVIRKLERQQTELKEILATLHHLDRFGVNRPDHTVSVEQFDQRLIADALHQANGNQSEAARILKISRDRLRYKMTKYRLHRKVNARPRRPRRKPER